MKRYLGLTILISAIGLNSLSSFAAPAYGTHMPEKGHWHWGWQTNVVLRRNLEREWGKLRSYQTFITGSFGLTPWLCFDGKLGWGNIKNRPENISRIDYPGNFAGGYGFRVKLYRHATDKIKSVFGFQHISVHPDHQYVGKEKRKVILDDWQFSFLVSYDLSRYFVPYAGVKLSRMDLIEKAGDIRKRKRSENSELAGMILGVDIYLDKTHRQWFNLECRFFDEAAISLGVVFSF